MGTVMRASGVVGAVVLGIVAIAPPISAEGGSPSNAALAEALFQDAKVLMEEGKFSLACPKLAESQRLDPTGGTLLNLARCHEQEGRLALAWAEYKQALAQAIRGRRPERIAFSEERIAKLDTQLARLSLEVPNQPLPKGWKLTVDGVEIGRAALGGGLPLDPGSHRVRATAPGFVSWEKTVDLQSGVDAVLPVPALVGESSTAGGAGEVAHGPKPTPSGVPDPGPRPAAPSTPEPDRLPGQLVLAGGALVFVAGTLAGWRALSLRAESDDRCPGDRCDARGVELADQAQTWAWAADIGLVGGLLGMGIGAKMLWWTPTASASWTSARIDRRLGLRFGATW